MSNSWGAVRFKDNTIMYFLYHGSSDICDSQLYAKVEETLNSSGYKECTCGNDEDVEIYSSYGVGSYWHGKACKHCKTITSGTDPFGQTEDYWEDSHPLPYKNGAPEWIKWQKDALESKWFKGAECGLVIHANI